MPKQIILFERLAYLTVLLSIVSNAMLWSVHDEIRKYTAESVAFGALNIAFSILLIWLIVRKRNYWARWFWIIVWLGGAVVFFASAATYEFVSLSALVPMYLAGIASACLLFTPAAREWCRFPPSSTSSP